MSRAAVFFDRDGTLSHEVGYVNHVTRFQPFPFAVDAIRAVKTGRKSMFSDVPVDDVIIEKAELA